MRSPPATGSACRDTAADPIGAPEGGRWLRLVNLQLVSCTIGVKSIMPQAAPTYDLLIVDDEAIGMPPGHPPARPGNTQ
jgi:hypothetical protein